MKPVLSLAHNNNRRRVGQIKESISHPSPPQGVPPLSWYGDRSISSKFNHREVGHMEPKAQRSHGTSNTNHNHTKAATQKIP